jgi:methylaspartate ammonia-lyase
VRVRFELVEWANSLESARECVAESASDFLQVAVEDVPSLVDFEYKVEYSTSEDREREEVGSSSFKITAYGAVKNSVLHPGK